MVHVFPFGKYHNCSLSQVALGQVKSGSGGIGYSYLAWFDKTVRNIGQGLREDVMRHMRVLNNFQAQTECYTCKKPGPTLISGITDYDGYYFFNSIAHVYHNTDECLSSISYGRASIHPIRFDSILRVTGPRIYQSEAHRIFRELAGFEGAVTKKAAAKFIDNLEAKMSA